MRIEIVEQNHETTEEEEPMGRGRPSYIGKATGSVSFKTEFGMLGVSYDLWDNDDDTYDTYNSWADSPLWDLSEMAETIFKKVLREVCRDYALFQDDSPFDVDRFEEKFEAEIEEDLPEIDEIRNAMTEEKVLAFLSEVDGTLAELSVPIGLGALVVNKEGSLIVQALGLTFPVKKDFAPSLEDVLWDSDDFYCWSELISKDERASEKWGEFTQKVCAWYLENETTVSVLNLAKASEDLKIKRAKAFKELKETFEKEILSVLTEEDFLLVWRERIIQSIHSQ